MLLVAVPKTFRKTGKKIKSSVFLKPSAQHCLASECKQSPSLLPSSPKSPEGYFSLALLNCGTEIAKH